MFKLTFTVDPDEMDEIIAIQLRDMYMGLVECKHADAQDARTKEAILTVLEHVMRPSDFEQFFETVKEL